MLKQHILGEEIVIWVTPIGKIMWWELCSSWWVWHCFCTGTFLMRWNFPQLINGRNLDVWLLGLIPHPIYLPAFNTASWQIFKGRWQFFCPLLLLRSVCILAPLRYWSVSLTPYGGLWIWLSVFWEDFYSKEGKGRCGWDLKWRKTPLTVSPLGLWGCIIVSVQLEPSLIFLPAVSSLTHTQILCIGSTWVSVNLAAGSHLLDLFWV